jgi:hypothetical protein
MEGKMKAMNYLEALADCIMKFEGWHQPGSVTGGVRGSASWRNRNPGNLRSSPTQSGTDDKGYAIFESLATGWIGLLVDLEAKFKGSHNLTLNSTLLDLMNIYAPTLDHNDPEQYARTIALWLSKIYNSQVTPQIKLSEIQALGQDQ